PVFAPGGGSRNAAAARRRASEDAIPRAGAAGDCAAASSYASQPAEAGNAHGDRTCLCLEADIRVSQAGLDNGLLPGAELVLPPVGIIEILVEADHGADLKPLGELRQHETRRGIDVAIDVEECD